MVGTHRACEGGRRGGCSQEWKHRVWSRHCGTLRVGSEVDSIVKRETIGPHGR